MKKETRNILLFCFAIFKILIIAGACYLLVRDIWEHTIILLLVFNILLSIVAKELNGQTLDFRKWKKKSASVWQIILEFIPDLLLIIFSLYVLIYLYHIWASWLNILIFFLLVWFAKSTLYELTKYYNKAIKK